MKLKWSRILIGASGIASAGIIAAQKKGVPVPAAVALPVAGLAILTQLITNEQQAKSNPDGTPAEQPYKKGKKVERK